MYRFTAAHRRVGQLNQMHVNQIKTTSDKSCNGRTFYERVWNNAIASVVALCELIISIGQANTWLKELN